MITMDDSVIVIILLTIIVMLFTLIPMLLAELFILMRENKSLRKTIEYFSVDQDFDFKSNNENKDNFDVIEQERVEDR